MAETTFRTIGIDLGTAYTRVAACRNGQVEIIPQDGLPAMPSYVAFTRTTQLVGEAARRQAHTNPSNTIFEALRFIGSAFDDAAFESYLTIFPFNVVREEGGIKFQVEYMESTIQVTPAEILAMILTKAKENAEAHLGHSVDYAVITIPPAFGIHGRQTIREIAEVVGLKVLGLISGPTAAAVNFAIMYREKHERNIIVVDFGAASLGVTVANVEDGIVEIHSVAGNRSLGGSDLTLHLYRQCFRHGAIQSGTIDSPRQRSRLWAACERAKRALSSQKETRIEIDSFQNGHDFTLTLHRSGIERQWQALLLSSLEPIKRALGDAHWDRSSVHDIVTIGGSTRVRGLEKVLSDFFNGKETSKSLNADEASVCGAALYAAYFTGDDGGKLKLHEFILLDVSASTLGVRTSEGTMIPLVERNTTLPTKKSAAIDIDGMHESSHDFCLFEGEHAHAKDNAFVASVTFPKGPRSQFSRCEFEITCDCPRQGLELSEVSVKHLKSERQVETSLREVGKFSVVEIQRLRTSLRKFKADNDAEAIRLRERDALESAVYTLARKQRSSGSSAGDTGKLTTLIDATIDWIDRNPWATTELYRRKHNDLFSNLTLLVESSLHTASLDGTSEAPTKSSPQPVSPGSNGEQSMEPSRLSTPFQAQLEPQQFRLLYRVARGSLSVKMKVHKVEYPPSFRALSYVWGSQPNDKPLICFNEGETAQSSIEISETLQGALEALATEDTPIWVDAVCINQDDPEEKSQQVALMHQIYRRADSVVIWLGPHQEHSGLALDVLKWIAAPPALGYEEQSLPLYPALQRHLEQPGTNLHLDQVHRLAVTVLEGKHVPISRLDFRRLGLPRLEDPLWTALGSVLSLRWLTRLWTFQELLLARKCFVAIGNTQLPWATYFSIGTQFSLCNLLEHCISGLAYSREYEQRAITSFVRLAPFLNNNDSIVPFWRYLDEARHRDVLERVDRIYAVLSLANDALRSKIKIDYSNSWKEQFWQLYIEAAKAVMSMSTLQAILAGANSELKSSELPSWCPDFSQPCDTKPFGANARAGSQYAKSFAKHQDPHIIRVGGVTLCTISQVDVSSWSWPQNPFSIYGPRGAAARNLQWLDSCWSIARNTYRRDETRAQTAFVLTVLGETPPPDTSHTEGNSVWLSQKENDLTDLRNWLENLRVCAGPEDVEDSSERWHRFQAMARQLDDIWNNRRLCTTDNGRLGFASHRTRPGDQVALFFGESHVYVLRSQRGGLSKFISDAYIEGYMAGEKRDVSDSTAFQLR